MNPYPHPYPPEPVPYETTQTWLYWFQHLSWIEWALLGGAGVLAIILLAAMYSLIDFVFSKPLQCWAKVVDRNHAPARGGYGYVGGNGGGFTYMHFGEEWNLIVTTEDEQTLTVDCDPNRWGSSSPGDWVSIHRWYGLISGRHVNTSIA